MATRRIAGVALIAAAGLVVLLIGAYRGHWTAGQAVAGWPAPPPVGSCVGVPGGDEAAVVPCTAPHLQEVTRTVAATDPRRAQVSQHWDTFCGDLGAAYLGLASVIDASPPADPPAVVWSLPRPQYAYGLLHAPSTAFARDVGWLACTVRPQGRVAYTGSARGVGATPDRPSAFATCGSGTDSAFGFSGVSCVDPHDWQILGEWAGPSGWAISAEGWLTPSGDGPDPAALREACRADAATILGVADPTYGGVLRVEAEESFQGGFVPPPDGSPSESSTAHGTHGELSFVPGALYACRIAPADAAMQLTDGMERWGDRPPPLRPASAG